MTNPVLSASSLKAAYERLSTIYQSEGKLITKVDGGSNGFALFNQNHNMTNNLPTNKGQIWLSLKEAAEMWGIKTNSLTKTIVAHRHNFTENEIRGGGAQGKRTYITKEALLKLRNLANIKSRSDTVSHLGKLKVADKAITKHPEYLEAMAKLASVVENLTKKVNALEASKQSQDLSLELLPAPKTTPPDISIRAALNKFVRDTARNTNRFYNIVFNELYSQFYYTFGINIVSRAKKNDMPVIEYAEKYGHIQDLYDLARKIYSIKK